MNLIARLISGEKLPIEVEPSASVLELKEIVANKMVLKASDIRLVVRGRILASDELLLTDYSLAENDVVHVAKTNASQTSPTVHSTGSRITGEALASQLKSPSNGIPGSDH